MRRQVGLLIMKDENDILHEYLSKVTKYYDKILVLDGSDDDEGREICAQFPEVIFYEKDQNVLNGNVTDQTTRGFLWEKAKELVDNKLWVAILHPDEFPSENPLEMLEQVQNSGADAVLIHNLHFFLHTSQKEGWDHKPGDLIEPKMKYYMAPGHPEHRYFRFDRKFVYGNRHSLTVPHNIGSQILIPNFTHKQFTYRTLEQAKKRAQTRWDSGWQMNDYLLVRETGDMFFDTLKYPLEYRKKYPKEFQTCWYNQPNAYVAKLD